MTNENIRRAARAAGIPLWKIAVSLGISEPTLTRWLRLPLPADREERILRVIADIEKGGE